MEQRRLSASGWPDEGDELALGQTSRSMPFSATMRPSSNDLRTARVRDDRRRITHSGVPPSEIGVRPGGPGYSAPTSPATVDPDGRAPARTRRASTPAPGGRRSRGTRTDRTAGKDAEEGHRSRRGDEAEQQATRRKIIRRILEPRQPTARRIPISARPLEDGHDHRVHHADGADSDGEQRDREIRGVHDLEPLIYLPVVRRPPRVRRAEGALARSPPRPRARPCHRRPPSRGRPSRRPSCWRSPAPSRAARSRRSPATAPRCE